MTEVKREITEMSEGLHVFDGLHPPLQGQRRLTAEYSRIITCAKFETFSSL